jgi:glutamate dehydrogenase (NADP+)
MNLKNVRRGRIKEHTDQFRSARYLEGRRPWSVPCQVAIPAATQNELELEDARTLIQNGVEVVTEAANMPCTPDAVELFLHHKVLYAPGKAANAGGVATSGLEMSQNALHLGWPAEEVEERLKGIMKSIHTACVTHGKEPDGTVNYVKGANIAGFVKVADAMIDQGIV